MYFLVFQVYKVCSDTFDSFDQHYGRGLVKDTIKDGMCVCVFVCVSVCFCVSLCVADEFYQGFHQHVNM